MVDNIKPEEPSGYYLFGTDIFSIPCFRDSFLAGFTTLTSTSLLTFLFTSNSKKSFNYAFGAFFLVTFPYMMYCQNQHYDTLEKIKQVQDRIKQQTDDNYLIVDDLSTFPDSDLTPDAIV